MSNSPLVSYTKITPNRNAPRNHKIDTITIHCVVGQLSVETLGNIFMNKKASANYGIGTDGRIGMYVEETDRSWCSSNSDNDNRAVTIECASDTVHPYAINDAVYKTLINLCEDICRRNGIKELKWKADKSLIGKTDQQNMTVHRWFAAKACPGEYIYTRLGQIAEEVNGKLNGGNNKFPETPFNVKVIVDDLNIRTSPSMDGAVKDQTGKGVFTILEVSNGWGKLKSGAGWIWLGNNSYCTILSEPLTEDPNRFKPYSVQVKINNLNIRKGPGTNYRTNGVTGAGVFVIVKESSGEGSKKGWGKLKSGAGWISLDFVNKL